MDGRTVSIDQKLAVRRVLNLRLDEEEMLRRIAQSSNLPLNTTMRRLIREEAARLGMDAHEEAVAQR
jgi:hypothetical protein